MQDLNDKVTGGTLAATEWNEVPSELQNVIVALGFVLSSGDLNQIGKAIAGYAAASTWYSDVGAADVYICSTIGSKQGIVALDANHDGALVRFRPGNANTGASTINVNGTGAVSIVREDFSALQANDLLTTRDTVLRYRDTPGHFVLANYAITGSIEVNRGYIDGIITSQAADPDHDITFGTGICRDADNSVTIELSSTITKQIDVPWVAGNNQGGFPSALTLTAFTGYHLFLIKNPTSGVVDAGFDTSITATNLLADATGFTKYRRVGAVRANVSVNIYGYIQIGDHFVYTPSIQDIDMHPGTGEETHTIQLAPNGIKSLVDVSICFQRPDSAGDTFYLAGGGDDTLVTPSSDQLDARTLGDARFASVDKFLLTNTSQEVKTRQSDSNASAIVSIQVHGWIDPRGKDA